MSVRRELSDVRPGQVWRDRDKRMLSGGRRVRVVQTSLENLRAYVYYKQVVGENDRECEQTFKSDYKRFQRAFDLVADRPPSQWL